MKSAKHIGSMAIKGAILFSFLILSGTLAFARQDAGDDDLEEAFERKIQASSTRDLEAVVRLCKSAIEKGLDEEGKAQAAQLIAAASMEHAEQLLKRIFVQEGRPDPRWQKFRTEAIAQLNQATEFQPNLTQAYLMIAELNIRLPQGDIEAAKAAVNKAIEQGGEDRSQLSKALFFRASMSEDDDDKLADINQAIKIDPDNRDALKIRAVFLIDKNEITEGLEDINRWLSASTTTVDEYLEVIQLFVAMIEKWERDAKLLESEPDDEDSVMAEEIADNLEKIKAETYTIIEKGLEQFPEEVRFFAVRSGLYSFEEKWNEALAEIDRAIEIHQIQSPDQFDFRLLISRANIHKNLQNFDQALADYDLLLEKGEAQRNAAVRELAIQGRLDILVESERFDEAIEDLNKQLGSRGRNPGVLRMLAILHNANKESRKAIEIYDQLIEEVGEADANADELELRSMDEQLHPLFLGRGDARLSLGEHKEAIDDYTRALEMYQRVREFLKNESDVELPEDKHLLNNLAWVLSTSPFDELRDGEKAIGLAKRAAEAGNFSEAYILSTLASAYAEAGDFESAKKWIKEAIEVNRKDRELEETKRNLEQKDSLQKEYDHYLRNEPFRELQNVEEEKAAESDQVDGKEEENKTEADQEGAGE